MGDEKVPGTVVWRTVFTVVAGLGWLIGLLLWWAFFSEDFTIAQKFAVSIISLMVLGGLMAVVWIPFSIRWAPEEEREQWGDSGFTWRVLASIAVFIGLSVFLVYMLFFPWKEFDLCQSLVIIIIVVIVGAMMMAPVWMRWGMRKQFTSEGVVIEKKVKVTVEETIEEPLEEGED